MSIQDFQKAAADKNIELAMSALADDVVLRSPLTDQFTFDGKDDLRRLFETAYEKFDGLEYHTVIGDRVLVGSATVGGQPFEETLLLSLNDDGKIREITLFIRPLPGLTAVMAALGPELARRNGRSRFTAGLLKVMTAPLVAATRSGDRFGVKLALPKRT
jgi:hypothetical protein